ncbi:MAG: SurA N-terminal domain-containing protein [Psychroflexus sp.]|nr:SurA N-terminal domain-containing protein [Psychroflexus sp.]
MAILSKIRSKTVVLIAIIALALFAFVLADVIRQGGFTSNKSQNSIGYVGDEEIERKSFARQVENLTKRSRGQTTTMQAVNRVWDSRVNNTILKEQFDELGLDISSDRLIEKMKPQLSRDQRFTDASGNFSRARVQEYVANIRKNSPSEFSSWQDFENSTEVQILRNTYFNLIKAGLGATELEAKQLYKQENNQLTFEFMRVPFNKAEKVDITKSDIKKYIKNHNEEYKQEGKRSIQYVFYKEEPSKADIADARNKIDNLINGSDEYPESFKSTQDMKAFLSSYSDQPYDETYKFESDFNDSISDKLTAMEEGDVYGPYKKGNKWMAKKMMETKRVSDSAEIKHILVSFKEAGVDRQLTRTKDEAQKLADSLMNVIDNDSSKFGELAQQYSSDGQSKNNEGKLGWVAYGRFFKELNNFIFNNDEGFRGKLESEFGYHIVEVLDKKSPKKAMKIATLVREVAPSSKTINKLYKDATKFEQAAQSEDFEKVAEEKSKDIKKAKALSQLDEGVAGLGNQREIVRWAFEDKTQLNDIKRFDLQDGYVIAQLTEKTEEGLKPVEDVASKVTPILEKQAQAKAIKEQMGDASDLTSVGDLFDVTKQRASNLNIKNPVVPGGGKEPKVVGAAFGLKKNQLSSPITGNNGVYVIKLIEKKEAMELASYFGVAREITKERTKNISNASSSPVIEGIKATIEIEDFRNRFY